MLKLILRVSTQGSTKITSYRHFTCDDKNVFKKKSPSFWRPNYFQCCFMAVTYLSHYHHDSWQLEPNRNVKLGFGRIDEYQTYMLRPAGIIAKNSLDWNPQYNLAVLWVDRRVRREEQWQEETRV